MDAPKQLGESGAAQFLDWLRELRPVVQVCLVPSQDGYDPRADRPKWELLRDYAAKEVARRDGKPRQIVLRSRYADITRAEQQRALNAVRQTVLGKGTHVESRFCKYVVHAIAYHMRGIRGTWPSYSTTTRDGGPDVVLIQETLDWLFYPEPVSMSTPVIVKCLKTLRRKPRRSSRHLLSGELNVRLAYELLGLAEAKLEHLRHATGEEPQNLRAIRAAREALSPFGEDSRKSVARGIRTGRVEQKKSS